MPATLSHPLIMGILNATPDSFSDGGRFDQVGAGVRRAVEMLDHGADLVDVGGESTRPGAAAVGQAEEIRRVVPIIEGVLAERPGAVISVDTSKVAVAEAALSAGATWVNDVTALASPGMAALCAQHTGPVVLMHMRGNPRTMQRDTAYNDLLQEVEDHLRSRVQMATEAGIAAERLVLDPGVGFGKSAADNLRLFAVIPRLVALGHNVLIGASRKRFIGDLVGETVPARRVGGSVGAAIAAAARGAHVLRVHDVRQTKQALTVFCAINEAT